MTKYVYKIWDKDTNDWAVTRRKNSFTTLGGARRSMNWSSFRYNRAPTDNWEIRKLELVDTGERFE